MLPARRRRILALLLPLLVVSGVPVSRAAEREAGSGANRPEIFPTDAWELVAAGRARLIDVRSADERKAGSPRGVTAEILYPLDGHGDEAFVGAVAREVQGDRSAPLILICAAGPRSAAAQRVLAAHGFTDVKVVLNGFQGWMDLDAPRAR